MQLFTFATTVKYQVKNTEQKSKILQNYVTVTYKHDSFDKFKIRQDSIFATQQHFCTSIPIKKLEKRTQLFQESFGNTYNIHICTLTNSGQIAQQGITMFHTMNQGLWCSCEKAADGQKTTQIKKKNE